MQSDNETKFTADCTKEVIQITCFLLILSTARNAQIDSRVERQKEHISLCYPFSVAEQRSNGTCILMLSLVYLDVVTGACHCSPDNFTVSSTTLLMADRENNVLVLRYGHKGF